MHDALVELRDKRTVAGAFPPRGDAHQRAAGRRSAARCRPRAPSPSRRRSARADGRRIGADIVVVPVLRAGLGMLDAVLELVPDARVGHIGLQRDEMTAVASRYYSKLPASLRSSFVLMIDPMLATGGSAVAALELLREAGAAHIRIVCIVAAPEGIAIVEQHYPDVVDLHAGRSISGLNEHKYIVPGLGDFGDRLYGTV